MEIHGDLCHDLLAKKIKPKKTYTEGKDYAEWKREVKKDLIEMLGMAAIAENACAPELEIEREEKKDGYTITRFSFWSEIGARVPCYLLVPDTGKAKYPLCITLQGHSKGFHLSIGEPKFEKTDRYEGDEESIKRNAFALQAVERGFAALAIEQRSLGERNSENGYDWSLCTYQAVRAINMGRTLIGERVWDVQRVIDVVEERFPVCDTDKIVLMGSSGGGTATYYAACLEDRIKYAAPTCAVATFESSILKVQHCACNYVPSMYLSYEMQDFSCLIAPRPVSVITGVKDPIFPYYGANEAFQTMEKIYKQEGAKENCRLVTMPEGHYFCKDIVWDEIENRAKSFGLL